MRWLFLTVLFLAALAARADDMVLDERFYLLRETDQVAVIDVNDRRADVSMYIAIDGIPAGQTVTYVLPFWYAPQDFAMEEMESARFREQCVNPAFERVLRMNRLASRDGSDEAFTAAITFGVGFLGPFADQIISAFTYNRPGAASVDASSALVPFATHATPHASAELYRIEEKDLQQLVVQAGLPAKYAKPLKKYHTCYFAVMRLTGLNVKRTPAVDSERDSIRGVRYHFRHALPAGKPEYLYPLGTGAAWPKPILLTEVYITCPDKFMLRVEAPTEGKRTNMGLISRNVSDIESFSSLTPEKKAALLNYYPRNYKSNGEITRGITEKEYLAGFRPLTSTHLKSEEINTSAWHVAYFSSNPSEDIIVRLVPRRLPWRVTIAALYTWKPAPYLVSFLTLLIAWIVAARSIIKPKTDRAFRSLFAQGLRAFLIANAIFSVFVVAALLLGAFAGWVLPITYDSYIAAIFFTAAAVFLLILLAKAIIPRAGRIFRFLHGSTVLRCWLLATGIYLVLNVGLIALVYWCESSV
ncbi:MAG: hypothetical protein ACYDCO_20660 [Armatimonadota bacterium]